MNTQDTRDLTDEHYETLSDAYAKQAPELSGEPGFLTTLREGRLVNELLEPEYARLVNAQAAAQKVSQSNVIQQALKKALAAS
jgi:hypothetical protein